MGIKYKKGEKQRASIRLFAPLFFILGLLTQTLLDFKWYLGFIGAILYILLYIFFDKKLDKLEEEVIENGRKKS